MSLRFIIGDGRSDHEQGMLTVAKEWLQEAQQEVFFVVPNYNKFEREREILQGLKAAQSGDFASIRAQVYSFHRLAWYYLQQTGLLSQGALSENGATMIMRKLLLDMEEELILYRGEINKSGFVQQLLAFYQEMHTSQLSVTDLLAGGEILDNTDANRKFTELAAIFQRFEAELLARAVQVDQPITLLTRYLAGDSGVVSKQGATTPLENFSQERPDLSKTLYVISGFSSFSTQEQQLINVLMKKGHVAIDLFLDRSYTNELPSPLDLFYEAGRSYYQFVQFAKDNGVMLYLDHKLPPMESDSAQTEAFLEIESFWRKTQSQGHYQQKAALDPHLSLWKVGNPEEEVRQIATEIRRLMSETSNHSPLRYRDIQLLVADPDIYHQYIPKIFSEYEIPYYIDEEQMMAQHPLVEFLHAFFACRQYGYRLRDVFRLLRTELYLPQIFQEETDWQAARDQFRQLTDITENQALAHDFQGAVWTKEADWTLAAYSIDAQEQTAISELTEATNQLRRAFRVDIANTLQELSLVKTNREAVQMVYLFLIQSGVEAQLRHWCDQAIEQGKLDQARNHEQAWQALMDLFDEYIEVYGEDNFDFDLFEDIVMTGLETVTFGKIPTAIDQVNINRYDLARPRQAKITFAVGLNEGVLPRKIENHTLLTNEERQQFNRHFAGEKYLRDTIIESSVKEPFLFYGILLSATEHLYLSYACNFDTQQNIKRSPYLDRIVQRTTTRFVDRGFLSLTSPPTYYVGTYRSLIYQINNLSQQARKNNAHLPPIWQTLKQQLLTTQWRDLAHKVFESQTHQNIPVPLSQEQAAALYGPSIYSSISQMETFYQCEYKYFVSYGLRLKERDIYGLSPAMTGEFFHDALDRFVKVLITENITLTQLTVDQKNQFVEAVLAEIFGESRYRLLTSSARMNFIRYQLGKTIQRVAWALMRQGQKMHFSPEKTEVLFGQIAGSNGINGIELPLSSGGKLHVRGKIDRVDTAKSEEEQWLSVVDYKSSSRDFDLSEAYYGLAMQLITYLDVALTDAVQLVGSPNVHPAGAYYLHVHDPLLDGQEASEDERLKRFKYDGLFIDEPKVFPLLDQEVDTSKNSLIFPIRKDKNDLYQKTAQAKNKFYTEEELDLLRGHNRKNMQQSAEKLLSGDIALNPSYKIKDKKRACEFCPFRSICEFDVLLKENDYHRLENLSKEEIIQRLREEEHE
ncbi:PD-(D/E)XK nuclease family protein [Enterococcus sp. DIV0876]|uniref:PD-(D/E)XK nuclease family protein n=1 Tax=Enterococcus sp. DIV0876 TaxID=2774633 RepID=UPI003D2FE843